MRDKLIECGAPARVEAHFLVLAWEECVGPYQPFFENDLEIAGDVG